MPQEYRQIHQPGGNAPSGSHLHENQRAVVNRMARAIGHMEKVKRMVEAGTDCGEVLIQLAAVRSALDNTAKVIMKEHLRNCLAEAAAEGDEGAIDELCKAIDKFI
jgi:DNA-binding FrmR family transcriptional regulator